MSDNTTLQQRIDFLERQVAHLTDKVSKLATQYADLLAYIKGLRRDFGG
jgi:cell division septum initiation protein DivIVA